MNPRCLSAGIRTGVARQDARSATASCRPGTIRSDRRPMLVARFCVIAGLATVCACSAPSSASQTGLAGNGMFSLAPADNPRPLGNPAHDGVVINTGATQTMPATR